MPLWLLKFIPGLGGFLKGNWKIIGVAVALGGAFYMGAKWKDSSYAKERIASAEAVATAIQLREAEIRRQHQIQVDIDTAARLTLQGDLSTIRQREKDLMTRVRDLSLVKPIPEIRIEGCFEDDEGQTVVVGNPFSVDFVSVWNDAARTDPAE